MSRKKIFVSYAHKDEVWRNRLMMHLQVLERQGLLDVWSDRKIEAGDDWYSAINDAMQGSRVAILMVSTDFLVSEFINNEEIPALLQHHAENGMRIFPILVYPCPWKMVPWLSQMQIRPKDGVPLARGNKSAWEQRLLEITEEVYNIVTRSHETA